MRPPSVEVAANHVEEPRRILDGIMFPRSLRSWSVATDWNARDQFRGASAPGAARRAEQTRVSRLLVAAAAEVERERRYEANVERLLGMVARGERVPGGGSVYEARVNAGTMRVRVEVRGVRQIGDVIRAKSILDLEGREVGRDVDLHDAVRVARG